MEQMLSARIALTPRPVRRRIAALEVGMVGHCPGRVRHARLLALPQILEEMRDAGFGAAVDGILAGSETGLYHVPIPLHTQAEFRDIFPDAHRASTDYTSVLAGDRAWLAQAVADFFANGGEKLWIVRVPQAEAQEGFLPRSDTVLHDITTLRGLALLLTIPNLAVVAFPDLERLQIPARLPDIPRNRLDNPDPRFLPCSQTTTDDHRERRYPSELVKASPPRPIEQLLRSILTITAEARPDIFCLFTLPLAYSGSLGSPTVDETAIDTIATIRDSGAGGDRLRQIQFLFPYLRSPGFRLRSAVGLVAGLQSDVARREGPWRSVSAQPMITDALPFPHQSIAQTLRLRENPGVGVVTLRNRKVMLDDERLVVPALHPADYRHAEDSRRFDGFRSAEVGRLLGYLRRQLQALGETLVFDVDNGDNPIRFALAQFFRQLHSRGALRGALAEDGFQISRVPATEGTLIYEIMISPTFPIDRLYLTFTHRNNGWQTEVRHV